MALSNYVCLHCRHRLKAHTRPERCPNCGKYSHENNRLLYSLKGIDAHRVKRSGSGKGPPEQVKGSRKWLSARGMAIIDQRDRGGKIHFTVHLNKIRIDPNALADIRVGYASRAEAKEFAVNYAELKEIPDVRQK